MTRRPLNGRRRITGDTASHAAYGVGPATDYGADEGEIVYAPFPGSVYRYWSDTGGNSVRVTTADGRLAWVGQHFSAYRGSSGWTDESGPLGGVGDTGSMAEGPHLHNWIELDGVRMSMEEFLVFLGWPSAPLWGYVSGSSFAGSNAITISESPEEDEMIAEFYIASSNNKDVTVGAGDIWVRSEPGAELRRLTQGQATEYFAKYGLDFRSPSVHSQPGDWFDRAFAEDAVVHGYNIATHPYLAASTAQLEIDAAAVAKLADSLKNALPKAPSLAEITAAFAMANDADVTALTQQIVALGKNLPEAVRKTLAEAIAS